MQRGVYDSVFLRIVQVATAITKSNDAGVYRFDAVDLGMYDLQVTYPGFRVFLGAAYHQRELLPSAHGGAPAYQYVYAWRTPVLDGRLGTFHSSEIAFVFDNDELFPRYCGCGQDALALSHKMGAAWSGFAKDGNPGHREVPEWPAYTAERRATIVFDNQCAIKNDLVGEGLRLIRQA